MTIIKIQARCPNPVGSAWGYCWCERCNDARAICPPEDAAVCQRYHAEQEEIEQGGADETA